MTAQVISISACRRVSPARLRGQSRGAADISSLSTLAGTDIAPTGHAVPATFLQRQEAARAEANRIHARSRDLVRAARRFLAECQSISCAASGH
jgi:hypothetical protein